MSLKKILVFHHFGGLGGAGLSLLHIVESLLDKTREVIVYCPDKPDDIVKILNGINCEVIKAKNSPRIFAHYSGGIKNFLSLKSFKNLIDILLDAPKIINTIKNIKPDIIIVNSMTLFWIGFIAKKFSIETVCFHRETYIKGIFGIRTKIIKKGLSKWFDKVVFISDYDLRKSESINSQKFVINDRVDLKSFENYTSEEAKKSLGLVNNFKYVLYLGGFSKLKGSHVVMEAFKYLKNYNVKLLFVGGENIDKNTKKKYLSFINTSKSKTLKIYSKYNLEESVIFLPKTATPELLYKASDLVVFPSTKPHQARPIYEAGITKIPIIITDFEETKEFAINKESAFTFSSKNSKELSQIIKNIITDTYSVDKIIEKNYELTKSKHNLSSLPDDLNRMLLLNKKGRV